MSNEFEKLITRLSKESRVLGVMLFGSQAQGIADKFSDIDVYVLLSKAGKHSRLNYATNGTRLDIFFDTVEQCKGYLKGERRSVRRITSHMLANGTIVFERGSTFRKLQESARKNIQGATTISHEELLMHWYSIDDFWGEVQRDYQSGDAVSFGMNCQLLVANITELVLKLRGGFFCPPRGMKALLTSLDKSFSKFVGEYSTSVSAKEKVRILGRMVRYAYKISGGSMPRRWALK